MHDFTAGLSLLFSGAAPLYVVFGLALGFLVGLIPGMGAASATAVLLPFTLTIPLLDGLVLMVGIYAGTSYSMAIPAILLNVPTEPGAAVTALDGHPMAKMGRAAEAIGIARLASVTGGIVGIGAALVLLYPLASVALKFGPSELFLLTIIGMTVVGGLVGESPIKGLLAGAVGFLIAGMGVNPLTSLPRLDFNQLPLFDGMPFIPAVIGLFAVTEMFFLAARAVKNPGLGGDPSLKAASVVKLGGMGAGLMTTARYPAVVIRSGVVGLILGLIPGIGHSVANFISYSISKKRAKDPETWGKGNPQGIIASEGCDNGVTGGAMVPMLALGIPGSGTTAVLLSALALHGIQPGPQVLSSHGNLAYAVLIALFLANLFILPIGVALAWPMIWFTRLRLPLLIPLVLSISVVGAYAYRQENFDLKLLVIFGVIGILMRLGGYPMVPMLIGLVLGPLCEQNLLLSLQIGQDSVSYFWSTSIDKALDIILLLILVSLAWSAFKRAEAKAGRSVPVLTSGTWIRGLLRRQSATTVSQVPETSAPTQPASIDDPTRENQQSRMEHRP